MVMPQLGTTVDKTLQKEEEISPQRATATLRLIMDYVAQWSIIFTDGAVMLSIAKCSRSRNVMLNIPRLNVTVTPTNAEVPPNVGDTERSAL
ncbi:hypothetical protein EVAR_56113_1 [Eumeta japonica]|uniref:Uncharacterized protein n=1 Tax=Eumeta variegata TaxID=151549 RepID=A0A4C1YHY7_EUMVA|nr:hypothetical protein EVAR_56113_1 [Eumeta japonica]